MCPSGTSAFTVSPNPSSQQLKINLAMEEPEVETDIVIYNQLNVPVHTYKTKETEVLFNDLGLQPGVYLIEVKSGKYREVKRVMISSGK
jgi:hypothetical protein